MTRIGLLSDTHGYLDESILKHLSGCDEIWHAGDIGSKAVSEKLSHLKPFRAVYGNVDGTDLRNIYPETLKFTCENVSVLMIHIGGYPGKYSPKAYEELRNGNFNLFITGHSHILKIIFDKNINCLHINPGAAGKYGWHQVRTLVRFEIDGERIKNCEIIEMKK